MAGSSRINELPPSKRFKLLQQHLVEADSKPSNPQCLPAKKRINSHHYHQHQPTSLCLPAKKRIWAINPHQEEEEEEEEEEEHVDDKERALEEEGEVEEDDGIVCAVCRSTDGDPSDPIVFCDGCDLTVHASCYGRPLSDSVPEGDWFCRRCEEEEEEKGGGCCLCPTGGGAVKPTVDGGWAHITCALFVPEAFFRDAEGREGIDVSRVPAERREVECCLCGRRSGCGVVCSEPKCGLGFHVSCGLDEGLCIEYKEGKGQGPAIVAAFCRDHTLLWNKQQLTGKFKIVAMGSDSKRKARGRQVKI